MIDWITFSLIILAFLGISFWESSVEGKYGWAAKQVGWKIYPNKKNKLSHALHKFFLGHRPLTSYHFWLFGVTIPSLLIIPLLLNPTWDMTRIILAGYFIGVVIEDFVWFIVNPVFPIKDFNSKKVQWHRWLKIGKFEIPDFYVFYTIIGLLLLFLF